MIFLYGVIIFKKFYCTLNVSVRYFKNIVSISVWISAGSYKVMLNLLVVILPQMEIVQLKVIFC